MSNVVQFRGTTAVLTLIAASIGGGLIAAFAVSHNSAPVPVVARADTRSTGPESQRVTQLSNSFADIVEKASPAVVKISSTRVIKASEQGNGNPLMSDPFFQQFFGGRGRGRQQDQRESGLGSGVLVSSSGYILTNNHVIDKATTLKVELSDGRIFTGKTVGADPQTDVAVVKISADSLPTMAWGNSEAARVGDLCFAIGNPFGQDHTVTMGIVSAKGRSLKEGQLQIQNFIQTDASINPGNSGGALINTRGELIGMNTMIITGGSSFGGGEGGSVGIGFAVPSNMAKQVFDQLVKNGKVSRGYMAVTLGPVTPDAAPMLGLKDNHGAVVGSVVKGGPGEKAGLKPGDVITTVDGKTVADGNETTMAVVAHQPGDTVTLGIMRNGNPESVKVTLGQRPTGLEAEKQDGDDSSSSKDSDSNDSDSASIRGIHVQALSSDITTELKLPPSTKGVVVVSIDPDSSAADNVFQGMVIVAVNRQPVSNMADFKRLMKDAQGKAALLTYNINGSIGFTVVPAK
jgi:Do/DeqQ family serine protease